MPQQSLVIDAWIREAQEASKLVEDIENRMKNKNKNNNLVQEQRLAEMSRSKLLEVGVKLDRLESLLHNPPAKPILSEEDLRFRWKMISDFRLRTRALAFSLYASPSPQREGSLVEADGRETNVVTSSYEQDQLKPIFPEDGPELLKPLVSNEAVSGVQIKSMSFLRKLCWTALFILVAAALVFILIILSAAV